MKQIEPIKQPSNTLGFVVGVIISVFSVILSNSLNGQSWTEEKIGMISQMIVQFDAFLSAGATVGVSVFWTGFADTIRKGSTLFQKLVRSFNEMVSYSGSQTMEQESPQKIAATERASLPTALLGIVFFVISAVVAVIGEMFDNIFALGLSLDLLVAGSGIMFVTWYAFNFYGAELRRLQRDTAELITDIERETANRRMAPGTDAGSPP